MGTFLADAVRDLSSDVNTKAGIPDPTFGGIEFASSEWQMSLDVLEEYLTKNLLALTYSPPSDKMLEYISIFNDLCVVSINIYFVCIE